MDLEAVIANKYQPTIIMSSEQKEDIIDLLRETGEEHHKAYIKTDGNDPEWPLWYAEFMHTRLMDIMDLTFTKSELVYLLVAADLEQRDDAPDTDWVRYYADFILESLI